MTPYMILIGYLIAGVSYALYQWLLLMIEIQTFSNLLGKDKPSSFLARLFGPDSGNDRLKIPADPRQFTVQIGRWIFLWPFIIIRQAINALPSK